jgi:hypothetical protein
VSPLVDFWERKNIFQLTAIVFAQITWSYQKCLSGKISKCYIMVVEGKQIPNTPWAIKFDQRHETGPTFAATNRCTGEPPKTYS